MSQSARSFLVSVIMFEKSLSRSCRPPTTFTSAMSAAVEGSVERSVEELVKELIEWSVDGMLVKWSVEGSVDGLMSPCRGGDDDPVVY